MITTDMKAKRGKCLALAAVLAMVVCAFAVAMPASDAAGTAVSEAELDTTDFGTIPDDKVITEAKCYLVPESMELTIKNTTDQDVTLYVKDGATVTLVGSASNAEDVIVGTYTVKENKTWSLSNDTTITVDDMTAGKVAVKAIYGDGTDGATVSSSYEMSNAEADIVTATITIKLTSFGGTQTDGTVSVPAGKYFYSTAAVSGLTSAALVSDASKFRYDGTADKAYLNNSGTQTVTVFKGTTTIKSAESSAKNVVELTDIDSATGITFACADTTAQTMTVKGGADTDKGTMRVVTGTITVASGGLAFPGVAAFTSATIANDVVLGATLVDAGVADENGVLKGAVYVYGDMSAADIKLNSTGDAINLLPGASLDATIYVQDYAAEAATVTYTKFIDGTIINPAASGGSNVTITGDVGKDAQTASTLTIANEVQMDAEVFQLVTTGALTIVAGQTLTFDTGGKVVATANSNVVVLGTVTGIQGTDKIAVSGSGTVTTVATNIANLEQYTTNASEAKVEDADSAEDLYNAVVAGYKYIELTPAAEDYLGKDIDAAALEAEGVTIVIKGSNSLVIGSTDDAFVLSLVKSTIKLGDTATASISVVKGSALSIDESNIYMPVTVADGATVVSINNTAAWANVTSDATIGFGATVYVAGSITSGVGIVAYGELVVAEGTELVLPATATITMKQGSKATVDGALTIAGTMTVASGAEADIDGSLYVASLNGNAIYDNAGKTTVDGELVVSVAGIGMPANFLKAGTDFTVNGTLDMGGKLSGTVNDKGTVYIDGIVEASTQVVIYDGITVSIESVSGENALTISDAGIASKTGYSYVGGSTVKLSKVEGVVVTEDVIEDATAKTLTGVMSISGTVTTTEEVSSSAAAPIAADMINAAAATNTKIVIDGYLAIGQQVGMTISGTFEVTEDGCVDAIAKASKITNNAALTVDGEINTIVALAGSGSINAAMYTTSQATLTESTKTYTYTSIDNALMFIPGADEDTVTVLGSLTLKADATVEAGEKLVVSGALTIGKDATLTVEETGKITTGEVTVDGVLGIENYAADCTLKTITADVLMKDGDARVYTSLPSAIALELTDISLNRDVDIASDLTIPEGTKVTSDYAITVKKNTVLTVAGELEITKKGYILSEAASTSADVAGKLVVTGEVTDITTTAEPDLSGTIYGGVSGAWYTAGTSPSFVLHFTTLANAVADAGADMATGKINVQGTMTVDEDLEFVAPAFGTAEEYTIVVGSGAALTVETLALDGTALDIQNAKSFNGDVAVVDADVGTTVLSLTAAKGVLLRSATIADVEVMNIEGTLTGQAEILSGAVSVYREFQVGSTDGTANTNKLAVASGAYLAVPQGSVLTAGYTGSSKAAAITVDGTLTVVKGTANVYNMTVNGAVLVSGDASSTGKFVLKADGTLQMNGTMDVESTGAATVETGATVTLGSKPAALGAEPAITGTVAITGTAVIKAYSGSVESVTDGTNALKSTVLYINGTEYFEVWSATGTLTSVIGAEKFSLSGLVPPSPLVYYSDAAMKTTVEGSTQIGECSAVYMDFEPSTLEVTVTVGAGLRVYIDGVYYNGAAKATLAVGVHTLAYEVTAGYDAKDVKSTFNGAAVANGGTFTITADMTSAVVSVTGATASVPDTPSNDKNSTLTDTLLIVLVVLIAVMAIMVALKLMRS